MRKQSQRDEFEKWREVVRLLRKTGAVTEGDLASSPRENKTPGQQLFAAINAWGESMAVLRRDFPIKPEVSS